MASASPSSPPARSRASSHSSLVTKPEGPEEAAVALSAASRAWAASSSSSAAAGEAEVEAGVEALASSTTPMLSSSSTFRRCWKKLGLSNRVKIIEIRSGTRPPSRCCCFMSKEVASATKTEETIRTNAERFRLCRHCLIGATTLVFSFPASPPALCALASFCARIVAVTTTDASATTSAAGSMPDFCSSGFRRLRKRDEGILKKNRTRRGEKKVTEPRSHPLSTFV